jgi:hypothetical protein
VLAARRAPTVERPPAASFDAQICAIVLVLTMLPLAAGADPYARAAGALTMAPASTPTWQTPYPPLARLALLLVTAVALVAAALTLSGRSARTWWLAAWGLGAPALVLSLRASLTGKPWGWAEWTAAAAWLALGVWLHRRRARAALSAHLVHAGAVVALAAFVGIMMRAEHQVVLETAESAELNDPLGSEWRFTSEGLSMYDELNRQAAVVLLSARHGGRATNRWNCGSTSAMTGHRSAERRAWRDSSRERSCPPSSRSPGLRTRTASPSPFASCRSSCGGGPRPCSCPPARRPGSSGSAPRDRDRGGIRPRARRDVLGAPPSACGRACAGGRATRLRRVRRASA